MRIRTNYKFLTGAVLTIALVSTSTSMAQESQTAIITPPSGTALNTLAERIDTIEQQLRTITGKIEETQFTANQALNEKNQQLADMERRMNDLEVRVNSAGVTTAETAPRTQVPAPIQNKATLIAPSNDEDQDEAPTTATDSALATDDALETAPSVENMGTLSADGQAQAGTAEALYESAFKLLKESKYDESAKAFENFLTTHPKHEWAGNAQYWLGETYYAREDFSNAAKSFAKGYQLYRTSPKAADNLLKLGLSLQSLGAKEDACVTYAQLIKEYSNAADSLIERAKTEQERLVCGA